MRRGKAGDVGRLVGDGGDGRNQELAAAPAVAVDMKLPSCQRFCSIRRAEYFGRGFSFRGRCIIFYRIGRFAGSGMDNFFPLKTVKRRLFYSFGPFTGSDRDALIWEVNNISCAVNRPKNRNCNASNLACATTR